MTGDDEQSRGEAIRTWVHYSASFPLLRHDPDGVELSGFTDRNGELKRPMPPTVDLAVLR